MPVHWGTVHRHFAISVRGSDLDDCSLLLQEDAHHALFLVTGLGSPLNVAPGITMIDSGYLPEDELIGNEQQESRISMEDYALALVDELEKPRHRRQRFSIGY